MGYKKTAAKKNLERKGRGMIKRGGEVKRECSGQPWLGWRTDPGVMRHWAVDEECATHKKKYKMVGSQNLSPAQVEEYIKQKAIENPKGKRKIKN